MKDIQITYIYIEGPGEDKQMYMLTRFLPSWNKSLLLLLLHMMDIQITYMYVWQIFKLPTSTR